ncbi:MAG: 3-deoxy-D-manno-octulosonic acid transferase [Pseudomonadota bacterium]
MSTTPHSSQSARQPARADEPERTLSSAPLVAPPDDAALSAPMGLRAYQTVSRAAEPIAGYALKRRLKAGKEDPDRIAERRGLASAARPQGALAWIHGASVGESLSILPLVKTLSEARADLHFLVTTGTVTSARLMAERLPENAIHQYIPLDHPRYVAAFMDHWRPDAAVFVESEFWPNLILEARRRVRALALVNGRVSPKSYEDWVRRKQAIRYLLDSFDVLVAQDRKNAERLAELSGRDVPTFGNLKNAAPALPANNEDLQTLRAQIDGRPIWLAASTHPGEEDAVLHAHQRLKAKFPRLLTVLAPRHPARGEEIRNIALENGLVADLRSNKLPLTAETEVYVADTLGELGLFYRLSDISFVGGSLTPKGGHNPLEPARLGGAILHGPYTFNFVETYDDMRATRGAALVRNERELKTAVSRLLDDDKTRNAMAAAAREGAEASAQKVLAEVSDIVMAQIRKSDLAA